MTTLSDAHEQNGDLPDAIKPAPYSSRYWFICVALAAFVTLACQMTFEVNGAFTHWGEDFWTARVATWCATGYGLGIYLLSRGIFRRLRRATSRATGRAHLLYQMLVVIVVPVLVIATPCIFVGGSMYIGLWFFELLNWIGVSAVSIP